MAQDAVEKLTQASAGLLYPSESDEPFEVFRWKPSTIDPRQEIAAHLKDGAPVQEVSVAEFFAGLSQSADAARFAQLRKVLESTLIGLKVYRAGEVEVDIFLIGRAASDDWVGLHTMSVET